MISVQNQLEHLPIVFRVQFNALHRAIRTTSSDDAYPTRRTQLFNLTGGSLSEEDQALKKVPSSNTVWRQSEIENPL